MIIIATLSNPSVLPDDYHAVAKVSENYFPIYEELLDELWEVWLDFVNKDKINVRDSHYPTKQDLARDINVYPVSELGITVYREDHKIFNGEKWTHDPEFPNPSTLYDLI